MMEGSIILAALPQSDGQTKRRPALALRRMPGFGDYLVCGISTQLHQEIKGFDEVLTPDDNNRLKLPSVIRLGFLSVVPASQIVGAIGRIPASLQAALLQRLADYLVAP